VPVIGNLKSKFKPEALAYNHGMPLAVPVATTGLPVVLRSCKVREAISSSLMLKVRVYYYTGTGMFESQLERAWKYNSGPSCSTSFASLSA